MQLVKQMIHGVLRPLGFDIVRYRANAQPRHPLAGQLVARGITVVLDAGANTGQFAQQIRRSGYLNRIISFEPVAESFKQLKKNSRDDPLWEARNIALGATSHLAEINVSRNSVSSSLLDLNEKTLQAEPAVEYIQRETVRVEPLDSLFNDIVAPADHVFLKVDVQGYERLLFQGTEQSLPKIFGVIVECSLTSLYEGEWLFHEAVAYFAERGFVLTNIDKEFTDPKTGEMLQVNALFWNTRYLTSTTK